MFQLPTGVNPEHMYGAHFASRHATYAPVIDAVLYRLTVDRSPPLHRAVELYCRPPLGLLTSHDVGSWPMTMHPVVGMGVEGAAQRHISTVFWARRWCGVFLFSCVRVGGQ